MTPKKPMLACEAPATLYFPMYASPKLDGIRATVWGGNPLTRALKPIPNKHVSNCLADARFPVPFDGELVVGPPNDPQVYTRTTSAIMSHGGVPDFSFYVFDYVPDDGTPFSQRLERLVERTSVALQRYSWLRLLGQTLVHSQEELDQYEHAQLELGFEGVILRRPGAAYKHGRSTAKEQGMLKVKRFVDTELEVLGTEELMHNQNVAQTNALGYTQRSTAQAGLVPAGVLGALLCRWGEHVVKVGTGFTAQQRAELWEKRDALVGTLAKVKYFAHGMVDVPRHPVWLGFRDARDL